MNSPNQTIRILLADDDADDRQFFSEAIEELGINHTIKLFSGGLDLMNHLASIDISEPTADLLFLDLNMPCKTGLDCLREIRNDPKFDTLSIAIYSTSSSEKDIEETFLCGSNVYIKKPNDFSKLKKAIADALSMGWQLESNKTSQNLLFST
jgi:CheY-like chemotaxis protein